MKRVRWSEVSACQLFESRAARSYLTKLRLLAQRPLFWTSRRLRSPWNLTNLERDWAEVVSKGAKNEELEKIYNEAKHTLMAKEKEKVENSPKPIVASVG